MKLGKLQLELFKYIETSRRIIELEEKKNKITELIALKEIFIKLETLPELAKQALAEWEYLYEKELALELEILKLKKTQAKFMLARFTAV